jgi:hypothetical protein
VRRLHAIALEYATRSHNFQGIIELIGLQSPEEWEILLEAFEAFNDALPKEHVRNIVALVRRNVPKAQRPALPLETVGTEVPAPTVGKWQALAPRPRGLPTDTTSSEPNSRVAAAVPVVAARDASTPIEQQPTQSAPQSTGGVTNQRDLGALTGMFDDE